MSTAREKFVHDLNALIDEIKALPGENNSDFERKVTEVMTTIRLKATTAPQTIKNIIIQNALVFGWDMKKNACVTASLLTRGNVETGLTQMSDTIGNDVPITTPTEQELTSLSAACSRLWELDVNRLVPGRDYAINLQNGKKSFQQGDFADEPLFSFLNDDVLQRPIVRSFLALFDNYSAHTGVSEVVTREEMTENYRFLNAVMDTPVMQYVHQYLIRTNRTAHTDRNGFIEELLQVWFGLYSRETKNDSSGFEHVFLGEIKNGTDIVGFHNWLRIYLEEKNNSFNYLGYILPRKRGHGDNDSHDLEQLISIQFEWKGAMKNVSSSFIGVSPEFEFALYTLCFFAGNEQNEVVVGPYKTQITCYKWPPHPRPGQKVYIGTAFPAEPK